MNDDVVWNPDADPRRQAEPTNDKVMKALDDPETKAKYADLAAAMKKLTVSTTAMSAFQHITVSWKAEVSKLSKPVDQPIVTDDNHFRVHSPTRCEGTYCAIHNASNHFMRRWPRSIYALRVWRSCPHGYRHPDPDDVAYWVTRGKSTTALQEHDCDGCCASKVAVLELSE